MSRVENGKSKRRDYKRENFPGLTVSYRGLVEYQTEIVSAWRTRDKLPFLSFSPSLAPRSPIVIYTSIFGSIIFSLLSIVFRHICAVYLYDGFALLLGKILSGQGRKSGFGFSSGYSPSNTYSGWHVDMRARVNVHQYTRMRGIELHDDTRCN